MKKKILLLALITVYFSLNADAQLSRAKNKTSVVYRNNYHRMAAGSYHTLEIRNGTLWAWGSNDEGELGIDPNVALEETSPVQIGTDNKWVSVAAGDENTKALKSDGTLWSWGDNYYGELGIGTHEHNTHPTPVQIGSDNKWVSIAANGSSSFALKSDGTLWAWGDNRSGQLGDGTTSESDSPEQIGTNNNWISIAAGSGFTIALKSNGTLWAWGANGSGQLGDGSTTQVNSPEQIGSDNKWVSIAANGAHTHALKSDGTLWAWGINNFGQLGDGTTTNQSSPEQIGINNNWISIAAGAYHTLAMKSDGTLWAWGWNPHGMLGDGTTTQENSPEQIGSDNKWVSITAGYQHSLALKSDGTLLAWGWNDDGQIGNGTFNDQYTPEQVSVTVTDWASIAEGDDFSVALRSDGTLWAWGSNIHGQIGDGTTTQRNSPVQVGSDNHWISVAVGHYQTLALKSDGTLWAWGYNGFGQLGDGTTTQRNSPVQIGSDNHWVNIAGGTWSSMALKSDGTLWAWGYNGYGQLGDGNNNNNVYSPEQIGSDNHWASIAIDYHTIALKTDGTLWAWGYNHYGALGDGTTTDQHSPEQIGSDNNWASIAIGFEYTLALKSDGTLWAWGNNQDGGLGDGTTNPKRSPEQIGSDNNWISIAAIDYHSAALKSDGTLWAWGQNADGQLGDGSTDGGLYAVYSPEQITAQTGVVDVQAATNNSAIIKADRNYICMTGNNQSGQLGDGTTASTNTFECVLPAICNNPDVPVLSASVNPLCSGASTTITIASGNLNSATNWQWYTVSCGGTAAGSGTSITVSPTTTTTYYARGEGGCVIPGTCAQITITVSTTPPAASASSNSPVCSGNTLNLTSNGGVNYSWSGPNSFSSTQQNPGIANDSSANAGTYTIMVTNGCGSATASCTVIVNQTPAINAVGNQTLCGGSSTAAVNFSGTATVYNWTNSSTSIGLAASGTGNIASFTVTNSGTSPVTATITVTPQATSFAYITNFGSNNVYVINTATNAVVNTIAVGSGPSGVSVSPDGSHVYVTNSGSNNVSIINTATNAVVNTIIVGSEPSYISVNPDGSRVYVTNYNSNNVSVINTATNTVINTISVGNHPQGVSVSPDGSRVYVGTNASPSTVYVINATTNLVVNTTMIENNPAGVSISPDGSLVYVAIPGPNTVSVINTATNTVIDNIIVGTEPAGISISPNGSMVYVTNQNSNNVSVINTATNTVTSTIAVGSGPQGISVSPDGSSIYVANILSNTVSVINTNTNTVTATIAVGSEPVALGNFITGNNCSGTPVTFNITVNPTLTPTASSNSPVCTGNTINLTSSGGINYFWAGPSSFSSSLKNPTITNAAATNTGTYTVTVTNACGSTSTTIAVAVNIPDTWTQEANVGGAARRGAVGFSIGANGYIGTGVDINGMHYQDFWEWDQTTNTWTQKASFPGTPRSGAVGFSIGTKGYIGTGYDATTPYTQDFWEWDQPSNTWLQKTSFPGAGRQLAVGFSIGTKGYIGTGLNNGTGTYYKDFWEWDQTTNAWTQKAAFGGTARQGAVGFSLSTKGYIGTGYDGTLKNNDFWEWDQTTNTWAQKADFGGQGRSGATGFSIGSTGYIGMGYAATTFPNDFWEWDQAINTWYLRATIPGTPRELPVGFSIGMYGYIGTGDDVSYLQDFWQYSPVCATTNTITTNTISGTGFCPADSFIVPYTASGTFNSGNTFIAQLSDANGGFASPVQIGTLLGTASDSISCIIPPNTTSGAGYKIRVVSSSPIVIGSDNGINITIGVPAMASSNSPTCSGTTLNLASSGGTSYSWEGPNSFTSTFQNPSIASATTAVSGTYSVTATNSCGSATTTALVVINALPTAILSGGGKVCSGATSANVNIALTGSAPWALTYSINGVDQTPVTGIASTPYTINGATPGNYAITSLSDAHCTGTSFTGSATVTVNPLPTAAVSGGGTACAGSTLPNVNVTLTGAAPWTLTYAINGVNQTQVSGILSSPYIFTSTAAGTYIVTALNDANCTGISFTGSATVAVNPSPNNPGNPTSNSPQCASPGVTLTANGSAPGGETWYWETSASATSTANPTTSTYNASSSGTYYIRSRNNTTSCWSTGAGSATVTVNPLPTATATSNAPICIGGTLNLTAGGGTSYSWTGPNGFTSTQPNPTINNVTSSGTYSVNITDANGCSKSATANGTAVTCGDHVTMSATNCTQTSATQMTIDLYLVNDGSSSLKLSALSYGLNVNTTVLNGGTLSWSLIAGTSDALISAIASNYAFAYNSANHQLRLSTNGGGITSGNAPALTNNALVHVGTFKISNTAAWASNSATGFSLQSSALGGYLNTGVTVYVGTATTTTTFVNSGINRDVSVDCSIILNPTAPSSPTAGSNSPLCTGSTLNLTSSTGAGTPPFTFVWTGPNGFYSSLQNPVISSVSNAAGGTYSVTIANFSGSTSTTTSVLVNPLPTVTASSNAGQGICRDSTINLFSGGGTSFNWTGPNSFISMQQNPVIPNGAAANAGNYIVNVTDANGCSATASASVVVNNSCYHVTMSVSNCIQTGAYTMNTNLYIINDGSNMLNLNSLQYGLNVNSSILNGGTLSWSLVPGTSDLPSTITSTFIYSFNTTANELGLMSSSDAVSSATAELLPIGAQVHIGTFSITNSSPWTNHSATGFNLQDISASGMTNTGVLVYANGANSTTGLFTTGDNRDVSVDCSISLLIICPSSPFAGNNGPACAGSAINLTSSVGEGTTPISYAWTGPDNFSSSLQNPIIASAATNAVGTYSVRTTNVCGSTATTTFVSVNSCTANLHLKMFIEGYYLGGGLMQPVLYNEGVEANSNSTSVDTIMICIVDSALVVNDPYNMNYTGIGKQTSYTGFWINDTIATAKGLLQTDGSLSAIVNAVPASGKYYLALRQRGTVCTWSAHPISIYDGRFYDFTTSKDSAYGSNQCDDYGEGIWSFYSGDWNQDENVDALDFPPYDYDLSNFRYGYWGSDWAFYVPDYDPTMGFLNESDDLNGDGNVDIYDYRIYDLNQSGFISSKHP